MTKAPGMRLLFLWPSGHWFGGVPIWLDYLLPSLAERGWDPVLGLATGPRYNKPERYLGEHPWERWVSIFCRTGTPEGRRRAILRAIRSTRPDLVVGVNMPDAYAAVARLRGDGTSIRVAMSIHGIEPGLYGDAFRYSSILDGVIGSNRLACRLAEEIGGIDRSRIHYAPYGIPPASAKSSGRGGGSVLRIGFVGRLAETQKRIEDLVGISGALDRAMVPHQFLIAGRGPAEARLKRLLGSDRALFLGSVTPAELPERVYRTVDALLITSEWETGPLVAWEAMAEGTPVVSSRYVGSGLESSLRDGENALLFDVGDAKEAARHLRRIWQERELSETVRRGGMRLTKERYSRSHSVDAWTRSFEAILATPPLPEAPDPGDVNGTGRLERLLGPGSAETVRELLRRRGPDSGVGAEWPHTYGSPISEAEFMQLATRLDRDGCTG